MNYIDRIAGEVRAALPASAEVPNGTEALFRGYAVLVLTKGVAATASDVHDVWSAWMSAREPDHESLVPFDALAPAVRAQDLPFLEAVQSVARAHRR